MKTNSILFLKFVVYLIAISTFIGLVWFPQTEGRATNLSLLNIYTDPLVIYSYIASIPFFVALHQTLKLLKYIKQNKTFSKPAINTVKNIKRCALVIIAFIVLGEAFIILSAQGDDVAGIVALGIYTAFVTSIIATAAAVFEKLLQNALDIKSENDLTV